MLATSATASDCLARQWLPRVIRTDSDDTSDTRLRSASLLRQNGEHSLRSAITAWQERPVDRPLRQIQLLNLQGLHQPRHLGIGDIQVRVHIEAAIANRRSVGFLFAKFLVEHLTMPNSRVIEDNVGDEIGVLMRRKMPRIPYCRINSAKNWRSAADNVGGRPRRRFSFIVSRLSWE